MGICLIGLRGVLSIFYCGFIWLLRRPDTLDSVPLSLVLSYRVLGYGGVRLSSTARHILLSTPDGTLKDASEITWYNSPSDATPITVGTSMVCTTKKF